MRRPIDSDDGETDSTSTVDLISEFGIFGIIVDPVIVQVPENATLATATVDDGTGPQDLVFTETQSFKVTPGVQSTAEPGQKFWIFDLPPAIEAALPTRPNFQDFDFNLDYNLPPGATLPLTIKAIFAGRVEVGGETFYFPLLPCTSDFSQIPAFQINSVMNIFDLLFFAFNNPNLVGCDNQVYDFTALDTPAIDIRKEVSVDGGLTFFDANNGASAPVTLVGGGAHYSLIVINTGNVDLVNVVINDATLGIVDFPVGDLAVGRDVVLTSSEIPALEQPGRCQIPGDVTNIATVDGESVATGDVVSDSDPAVVVCQALVAICDVDADGDVDRSDVFAIMAARNTPASGPDDPRDADGNGVITVLDARQCVVQCTNPRCAP